ncbi:MAG: alpha/beta fold hydrolase, partial [Alphaproteobacteria bacterium]
EVHEGNGPYLLLLHGMLSSRAQWTRNLAALARQARPVVMELWGHGRSPSPSDPVMYEPEAMAAQVEQIRRELGAEQWFVCGQSFGATVTLRYSLLYPERVKGQIFTNSTSALATPEKVQEIYADVNRLAGNLAKNGQEGLKRMRIHPIHAKRLPPGAQEELMADAHLLNPAGIANLFQMTSPNASLAEIVHATKVPTLLVAGEKEERFAPHRKYAEENIPGIKVVGVDGGHACNIEAPDAFNAAVLEFIRQHS